MDLNLLLEAINSIFSKDMLSRIFDVSILVLIGLVVQQILLVISGRLRRKFEDEGSGTENLRVARANTLTNVLFTSVSIAGWVVLSFMALDRFGVNIMPLLAGAGVLGLAISFGSQELVKDVISGFFFLLENQFNVGDIIEVRGKKGKVVGMSFRAVTLKDLENESVHIYRNSLVDVVTRYNKKLEKEAQQAKTKHAKS